MPGPRLYFESVRVGDELPSLAKAPIDRTLLARYAGATGDFNPLHVDEPAAQRAGLPSVAVPSALAMGFLTQLVTDWAPGAQVRRVSMRFVRSLWPRDALLCRGRVRDRQGQGGRYFLDLDVWGENQRGGLVVRGLVRLKVFYSAEDEARALSGQPPLVVNSTPVPARKAGGARRPKSKGGRR